MHAKRLLIAAKGGLGTDTALSRITGKAILPATEAYILRLWLRQEGNWISEDARGKWRPSRQCGSSPQSVPGMPCWRKPNRAAISAGSSARSDSGPARYQAVVAGASPEGRMKPVNLAAKLAAAETELACLKIALAQVKEDRDELRQGRDDWRREAEMLSAEKLIAAKLRDADERRFAPAERLPWWRRLAG